MKKHLLKLSLTLNITLGLFVIILGLNYKDGLNTSYMERSLEHYQLAFDELATIAKDHLTKDQVINTMKRRNFQREIKNDALIFGAITLFFDADGRPIHIGLESDSVKKAHGNITINPHN